MSYKHWEKEKNMMLGYPCNFDNHFSKEFLELFNYNINNVGDPFFGTNYKINTMDTEIEVLKWFADLWDINREEFWGYITNSGTEGNLEGILVGRERFPKAKLYTSSSSHYSLFKICKILRVQCVVVDSNEFGEMCYKDLKNKLMDDDKKCVIINANIGTTMTGAIDDVSKIYEILTELDLEYHLHADGALMGFVLPFVYNDISFKTYLDSISISGHKFLGVPFPCGVFMMEKKFKKFLEKKIEYIDSYDVTIMGSRNGQAPVIMKHIIDKNKNSFKETIYYCLYLSQWLVNEMQKNGINAWVNNNSITVVFPKPNPELIKKWSLATNKDISHIVVMPHVSKDTLEIFLEEYINSKSF